MRRYLMKKSKHEKNQFNISFLLQAYFKGWEAYLLSNTINRDLRRFKKEKNNNQSAFILLKLHLTTAYIYETILNQKKIEALNSMRENLINLNKKYMSQEDAIKLADDGIAKAKNSVNEFIRTKNESIMQPLFDRLKKSYNYLDENIKKYFDTRMDLLEEMIQFIQDKVIDEKIDALQLKNNIDKYVSEFFKQAVIKVEGISLETLEEQIRFSIDLHRLTAILIMKLEITQKELAVEKKDPPKKLTPEDDYKLMLLEHIQESNFMGFYIVLPLNTLKTLTEISTIVSQPDCVMKKPDVSASLIKKLHERIAKLKTLTNLPSVAHSPHSTFSTKAPQTTVLESQFAPTFLQR